MKIERISENKLKVTISGDELMEWDVSFEALTYNTPQVQELFWDLIRRAEDETGFFAGDSNLVVEAMPQRNDSFVMIITKTNHDGVERTPFSAVAKARHERVKKLARECTVVVEFDSFDDLEEGCRALENRFAGDCSLYKLNGKHYLVMDVVNELLAEDLEYMVCDFGRVCPQPVLESAHLAEHGQMLIPHDAIGAICSYF